MTEGGGRRRKERRTNARRSLFAEMVTTMQLLVELSLSGELDHEEDALFVVKVAVQTENIRMPNRTVSRNNDENDTARLTEDDSESQSLVGAASRPWL